MSDQREPHLELDDENGIAAQAARQGAEDVDPEAPLPDDGSGEPLYAAETLSAEDDDDLEDIDLDDEADLDREVDLDEDDDADSSELN